MADRKVRAGFGRRLNDLIAPLAPQLALRRELAMLQRDDLRAKAGSYQGAGRGPRSKSFRVNNLDATEAGRGERQRLSWIGRDMLRNNPRVVKIRRQLMNNVVGAGIQPTVRWLGDDKDDDRRKTVEGLIKDHCLSTRWDADGRLTMLGQQGLGFGSIVVDGEILFRRRMRAVGDGLPLNFQVQVLETDYLDGKVDGDLRNGNYAVQGVEFNKIGQRVAYHLFRDHPGSRRGALQASTRVDARNVIHAYDLTRPGMVRGASWLSPVVTLLQDLFQYQDGQVKRQEVASMFAAVLKTPSDGRKVEDELGTMTAGGILTLYDEEDMSFTDPPDAGSYKDFMDATDRTIAAAMGIPHHAFIGSYQGVNYTGGRMGRADTDPNIRDWQQNLMIAQVCAGFGRWIAESIGDLTDIPDDLWELAWTPPVRPVIDPTKDYGANKTAIESGQKSRRASIREQGGDPDKVDAEIIEERRWADENGITFSGVAAPTDENSEGADDGTD